MQKVYYNKDGWVCLRYPNFLPIENKALYIEVNDDIYNDTFGTIGGYSWRVVKGKLQQDIYNQAEYQANQIQNEIAELKSEIAHIKEDVEQVELFGMERQDYEEKKARCVQIILRLRELEAQININD